MSKEIFSVGVFTPTTGIVRIEYTMSLAYMIMYFSEHAVFEGTPQNFCPYSIAGSGIGQNYETMVAKFLADTEVRWTHFLSVEDDMQFPPDTIHRLARHRLPIVGCNYSMNKSLEGELPEFTACYENGKRVQTTEESKGLEETFILPQGVTLVAREVYESIPRPWYVMGYNPETSKYVPQDSYFSVKANRAGFKLYVDHDLSKFVHHIGPKHYTYKDASGLHIEEKKR